MLKKPLVVVNFKTYKEATGNDAVKLAKICDKVAEDNKASVAVSVQACDINPVARAVSIPVLAQHVDDAGFGRYTGRVTAECVKQNGAVGTLINHSERPLSVERIKDILRSAKEAGLTTIMCAPDAETAGTLSLLGPDFVATEPPELIGGKVSVSDSEPWIIEDSVKSLAKGVVCIVGAGVHSRADVKKAIDLGAHGVLVASGVVKASDPERALTDLVKGLI